MSQQQRVAFDKRTGKIIPTEELKVAIDPFNTTDLRTIQEALDELAAIRNNVLQSIVDLRANNAIQAPERADLEAEAEDRLIEVETQIGSLNERLAYLLAGKSFLPWDPKGINRYFNADGSLTEAFTQVVKSVATPKDKEALTSIVEGLVSYVGLITGAASVRGRNAILKLELPPELRDKQRFVDFLEKVSKALDESRNPEDVRVEIPGDLVDRLRDAGNVEGPVWLLYNRMIAAGNVVENRPKPSAADRIKAREAEIRTELSTLAESQDPTAGRKIIELQRELRQLTGTTVRRRK